MAAHPLAANYRAERDQLIALGRGLTDAQAATVTSACPAWSIKDVYAHLAGISTDIMAGNTENAATEAWADGHVADRVDRSLIDALDEWESAGLGVTETMEAAGDFFPFQLFVDQWTHGWDIRATLGESAAAEPDLTVYTHFFGDFIEFMAGRTPSDLAALTVSVGERSFDIGSGPSVGELNLDLFEYARISMGRRSRAQLDQLGWPAAIQDPGPYIDVLVAWSVNDRDVIDPAL